MFRIVSFFQCIPWHHDSIYVKYTIKITDNLSLIVVSIHSFSLHVKQLTDDREFRGSLARDNSYISSSV